MTSSDLRICSACGHALTPDGPCGFVSVRIQEEAVYLCHADDHSCYMGAAADPGKMTSDAGRDAEIERLRHEWDLLVNERADLNAEIVGLRERLLIARRLAHTATEALPDAAEGTGETDSYDDAKPAAPSSDAVAGDTSDGFHTFNELYEFRLLLNAALFNEWRHSHPEFAVHKSWRHGDGEPAFGGGWFIVVAQLPTGQITNHYPEDDWPLFDIEERSISAPWDGHSADDVAERLRTYLTAVRDWQQPRQMSSRPSPGADPIPVLDPPKDTRLANLLDRLWPGPCDVCDHDARLLVDEAVWAARADDRAAGIVRVDTRDEATFRDFTLAICPEPYHIGKPEHARCLAAAGRILAALRGETQP